MKKKITALLLASFVSMNLVQVASFAIGNDIRTKEITKKTSITKTHKQRAKSDAFKYEYINYDWWNNFNDEYLTDYIARAIKANYDLQIATLVVDEYYQAVKMQFANELPSATMGFGTARVKNPGDYFAWSYTTPSYANYEIDIFLKNRDKTNSAKKEYEASLENERAVYISVASVIGTAYFNIVKLDKMIELQEEIVKDRKLIYELMVARNKEGLTSTADTVKANKSYIAGNSDLVEYKKQRVKLLNQFANLIGENLANAQTLPRISFDKLSYTGPNPKEIPSEVITQRPDYLKAEKLLEKAGIDVKVAKKEFLPSISIMGVGTFLANDIGSVLSTKGALASLSAGLSYNFFSGGRKLANLRMKKDQYEVLLNEYLKTNTTAMQEINDALVSIKLDNEKLNDSLKQAKLERDDFGYSKEKFEQGTISKLDLTQIRENVLYTDKQVVNNKIDCMVDYIGLYKVVGTKL